MALRKRRPGLVYPTYEDWHYVGSGGGEPAFLNSWANVSTLPKLAFRMRETGVVDIQGTIAGGTSFIVFTLPATARPSNVAGPVASGYVTGVGRVPVLVLITTDGNVGVYTDTGGGDTYPDRVHFGSLQLYLDSPDPAP